MSTRDEAPAFQWTQRDRQRLCAALRNEPRSRVYRRLEALLLVAEGAPISEAARRARVDRSSVHRWVAAYQQSRDVTALADAPRSGRPRAANQLSSPRLEAAIKRDPRHLGFSATTWTVPLLASYLNQSPKSQISQRTLRRRLHESGYRWKRPRYVYGEREAHRPQKKGQ
jgi:transposase